MIPKETTTTTSKVIIPESNDAIEDVVFNIKNDVGYNVNEEYYKLYNPTLVEYCKKQQEEKRKQQQLEKQQNGLLVQSVGTDDNNNDDDLFCNTVTENIQNIVHSISNLDEDDDDDDNDNNELLSSSKDAENQQQQTNTTTEDNNSNNNKSSIERIPIDDNHVIKIAPPQFNNNYHDSSTEIGTEAIISDDDDSDGDDYDEDYIMQQMIIAQKKSSSQKEKKKKKNVTFSYVEERQYERIIDNTGMYLGLAIGWEYNILPKIPVTEVLEEKQKQQKVITNENTNKHGGEISKIKKSNGNNRFSLLLNYGYTRKELRKATTEAEKYYKIRQKQKAFDDKQNSKSQKQSNKPKLIRRSLFGF